MNKKPDIKIGSKFNRLTVIDEIYSLSKRKFLCKCECGVKTKVLLAHLKNGNTKSCGCLSKERKTKHGMYGTPEYNSWNLMEQRCNNKNDKSYSRYGGRGIKVCKRWLKFTNFYKDMGDKPKQTTIDRIDNNKGYSKKNCRWATIYEQANNKQSSRFLTYKGETKTITQWSRKMSINVRTLFNRINNNWSTEKALTTKSRHTQN